MDFPKKVFLGLLGIILLLFILHVTAYLSVYYGYLDIEHFFFEKFNFNAEKNVPSIFSTLLHLLASFSLATVALSQLKIRTSKWFWWLMSFVFFFLAFDELLRIHEKVRGNADPLMATSDTFLYNWVIFYGVALILLALVIFKPLMQLPRKTLVRFVLAGAVFVFGAFVLENIAGSMVWHEEMDRDYAAMLPSLFVISTSEELLEMLGVSFFIYAVLQFKTQYKITPSTASQ